LLGQGAVELTGTGYAGFRQAALQSFGAQPAVPAVATLPGLAILGRQAGRSLLLDLNPVLLFPVSILGNLLVGLFVSVAVRFAVKVAIRGPVAIRRSVNVGARQTAIDVAIDGGIGIFVRRRRRSSVRASGNNQDT